MTAWLVILTVGAGTYAFRAVMFAVLAGRSLPGWAERPMAFVAPAAIGALVGGMVLTTGGSVGPAGMAEVGAVTAAFLAVRRSGDVLHGLAVGFPVLWALTAIGG